MPGAPLRLRPRPAFVDKAQKVPTRLAWNDTDWGYTFGPLEDTKKNYVPLTTFRWMVQNRQSLCFNFQAVSSGTRPGSWRTK